MIIALEEAKRKLIALRDDVKELGNALRITKERRPEMAAAYLAAHPPKEKKSRRKRATEIKE